MAPEFMRSAKIFVLTQIFLCMKFTEKKYGLIFVKYNLQNQAKLNTELCIH